MADNVRGFVINSLNQFNTYLTESILPSYAGYSYVYDAYSYVLNAIYDNEYVMTYALIQLNERIDGIDTSSVDLSAYAKKSDLNTYVKKTELDNQSYVTTTVLSNQGYLTSHQDLTPYATKAYVFTQYPSYTYLEEKLVNIDLSTYVSKTELNNAGYLTSIPNTYATYTAISEMGYITSIPSEYITQTVLSNQSYAGYTYVYDSYAYIMGKISALELASGGGEGGTSAEGGITAISFNGTAASITGSVASIVAPINDSTVEIQINNQSYSFTLNQSTAYSINLGNFANSSDLNNYVTKTELSNAGYITSGLPSVTSNDNGKILMVVNGAWQLVSPATIYSGNATPSNANGNNGDIYLQS